MSRCQRNTRGQSFQSLFTIYKLNSEVNSHFCSYMSHLWILEPLFTNSLNSRPKTTFTYKTTQQPTGDRAPDRFDLPSQRLAGAVANQEELAVVVLWLLDTDPPKGVRFFFGFLWFSGALGFRVLCFFGFPIVSQEALAILGGGRHPLGP